MSSVISASCGERCLADQLASVAAAIVVGLVFGGLLWRSTRGERARTAAWPAVGVT